MAGLFSFGIRWSQGLSGREEVEIKEIARRLVGGVWRTGVVDEPDANGGSQPVQVATKHLTLADFQSWSTTPIELVAPLGNYKQAVVTELYGATNNALGAPTDPTSTQVQLSDDSAFNSVAQNLVLFINFNSLAKVLRGVPLGFNRITGVAFPLIEDGFMQEGGCGLYIWGLADCEDWVGPVPPTLDITAHYVVVDTDGLGF